MPTPPRHSALALSQLRLGAAVCCWTLGIALAVQVITWSLVTFTDMRTTELKERLQQAANVTATPPAEPAQPPAAKPRSEAALMDAGEDSPTPLNVNRQVSKYDAIFRLQHSLAAGLGSLATLALIPMLGLAIAIASAQMTPGVEKSANAFLWAMLIAGIVVPWNRIASGVEFTGLFTSYDMMVADATAARAASDAAYTGEPAAVEGGGLLFYARHLLLPLACMAGIAAAGLRFRSGTDLGVMPRDNFRIDPALEREASNVAATSLMGGGGRSAGALRGVVASPEEPAAAPRSIKQISPGDPLRRPI